MKKTFEQWLSEVDEVISAKVGGFTHDDLPDWCYRDAYNDGKSPKAAALLAIRAAREF